MSATHLTIGNPMLYAGFFVIVLIMIAIDMIALKSSGNHKVSIKEALSWTVIWITVAMLFNLGLWWYLHEHPDFGAVIAKEKALEFLTGYVLEKSLAVDNIFVFLMIFAYFKVPSEFQRRVLLYGVFGALIMRAIMIFVGAVLVQQFSWILYIFGAFLVVTGVKMMLPEKEDSQDLSQNPLLKWLKNHMRVTENFHQEKFFIRDNGALIATPLFLVLLMIELSDVIFAVDSIPAIFAVTTDPFIVLTSNIFAILGLRAMYFLLADVADRFHLLKYGLAIVLSFIGVKMLIVEFYHVPITWALGFVFTVLTLSILASWFFPNPHKDNEHV